MAFDQLTRNRLQRFVNEARKVLEAEFTRQLHSDYGLDPLSGTITPLENLRHINDEQRETARVLRDTLAHYCASPDTDAHSGLDRIVREQAFTVLNRLAALRMAEARGLLIESVGNGYQAKGFQLYARLAGTGLGETGDVYRVYLYSVFDELSEDLPGLFDRFSPQGRLFPRGAALLQVLGLINDAEIEPLWAEDETIGWIYQYFNSKEERKAMREASEAPRDSRELAVRNQFFTPRYVVEFLVENTLGRLWFNATGGQTSLRGRCQYLLVKPDEKPEPAEPLRDPRTLKLLDPACGSMHFGLYAFDLFLEIYREAWDWEQQHGPGSLDTSRDPEGVLTPLSQTYADHVAFLQDVPRLIIEHNIYGVDIDPRAVQIASLALWLRAQRSWQQRGLRPQDRPRFRRSNIVCAEPMPGEEAFLDEFIVAQLSVTPERKLLGQLVRRVFDAMKLAGEAGTLLKIEEEIASAVAEAKHRWLTAPKLEQLRLFADNLVPTAQKEFDLDVTGIADETFWERAEERIYAALRNYAEQAQHGGAFQRRLFANDAARGFAFIDLSRKSYDVVLMNPPFGYPSERSKAYVDEKYPQAKYDVLAAFIDRAFELLFADGYLGCITSRTVFFIEFFADWRRNLFENKGLQIFADLGFGVLDALVETAAFTIRNSRLASPATFIRLLSSSEKDAALTAAIRDFSSGNEAKMVFSEQVTDFLNIDGFPMAYWVAKSFRDHFARHRSVKAAVGEVRVGLQTGDDFRFIRTAWEVDARKIGSRSKWVPLAKGGEFRKFYDDIHLSVNWDFNGSEIVFLVDDKGKQRSRPQNVSCYYRPGLTYPMRTTSNFSPRVLPAGCIFNVQGNSVFEVNNDRSRLLASLAVLSTAAFESFTRLKARVGDMTTAGGAGFAYTPGLIGSMPFPELEPKTLESLTELAASCVLAERTKDATNEPSAMFVKPALTTTAISLRNGFQASLAQDEEADVTRLESSLAIEETVQRAYGFSEADALEVREQFGQPVATFADAAPKDVSLVERLYKTGVSVKEEHATKASQQRQLSSDRHLRIDEICSVARISPRSLVQLRQQGKWIREEEFVAAVSTLVSYAVGCAFGRWDIRFATGEKPPPELSDVFAPLPACPPGQLQNEKGLPLTREDLRRLKDEGRWSYPLEEIPWDGILVDDPGHTLDLEARVHQVLQVIWKDCWEAIEREACEILGLRTFRDYIRKPARFFADHLKRYSKSRRQAPIYWPLSTFSGSYSLWVYYPKLSSQTLYTAINDFIEPKLTQVGGEVASLRNKGAARSREDEKQFEAFQAFELELIELRDTLLKIAPSYRPNHDDGVEITAAPLWRLLRHKPWQKVLKDTWAKLENGDYDWAHLAMAYWPDRVREKCRTDKSLAIAHDLDELYVEPEVRPKKTRAKRAARGTA